MDVTQTDGSLAAELLIGITCMLAAVAASHYAPWGFAKPPSCTADVRANADDCAKPARRPAAPKGARHG